MKPVPVTDIPTGRLVIIDLPYLLFCFYYIINDANELLLMVDYVKYHYPEMKSPLTSSQYEFNPGTTTCMTIICCLPGICVDPILIK